MNIYFYDNYSSSYNRFGNKVAEKLVELDSSVKIFYIHDNYDKGVVLLSDQIKNNIRIVPKNKVLNFIKVYPPHSFLCFSFRIPDVYWTTMFNILSVPTYQVMHGIYVTKYKRTFLYLLKDMPRILSYAVYLFKLIQISKNKSNLLLNMVKKDISYEAKSKTIDEVTLSKNMILWGMHWKKWFADNLGYTDKTNYMVCGSFDFSILNSDKLIDNDENSITYISQTIAEDGRIEIKYFEEFLDNLFKLANSINKTFYIKLHPRSNNLYYKRFEKLSNVIVTKDFPISNTYISHYSALLTVPVYLKKNIVLVEFPNHKIPEEYAYMSSNIIGHYDHISEENLKVDGSKDLSEFFEYHKDPFGRVAQFVTQET